MPLHSLIKAFLPNGQEMAMITQFVLSDNFSAFSTVFGLLGDAAVLILTVYTLHITAFSRRLNLVSPSFQGSAFYGETIALTLMNKSLHALPVQAVFVMKKHRGKFYYINLSDYSNPVSIDSWSVKKIESEPFTKIENWEEDTIPNYHEIIKDAVIGIQSGNSVIWVKPYRKAPLREAKRAYKKQNYCHLTVYRKVVDGKVISDSVDCVVYVRMKDINGQVCLKKVYGKTGCNGGNDLALSEALCGYNAISGAGNSAESIKKTICEALEIDERDITVQIIEEN